MPPGWGSPPASQTLKWENKPHPAAGRRGCSGEGDSERDTPGKRGNNLGRRGGTRSVRGWGRCRRCPPPLRPRFPPIPGAAGPYREGALRRGAPGGAANFGAGGTPKTHPPALPSPALPSPAQPSAGGRRCAAGPQGQMAGGALCNPGSPRKLMPRLKSLLLSLSITIGAFISVPDPGCVTSSVQL